MFNFFMGYAAWNMKYVMKLHLQAKGMSLAIWDHTCHLTQVNMPYLNSSQRLVVNLPSQVGWKAELT